MRPGLETDGVYRSWSPIEGTHETEDRFSFRAIIAWGLIFFKVDLHVLPQLTVTIAFYDLHRCSGPILSSPIQQVKFYGAQRKKLQKTSS